MRRLRRIAVPLAVLVSTLGVSGCSDIRTSDLCRQYSQASKRANEVKDLKPSTATVNDLRHAVTVFEASLDQLQAVSDGRLDTLITNLRAAVQDFAEAAVSNGRAALQKAQPLLDDSLNGVDEQWALLKQQADAECGAG